MKDKLQKLCDGVRAIAPGIEIRLKPSERVPEHWSVMVHAVGPGGSDGLILIFTSFDTLDRAIDEACSKLANISQKMMAAVRQPEGPPSSDAGKKK